MVYQNGHNAVMSQLSYIDTQISIERNNSIDKRPISNLHTKKLKQQMSEKTYVLAHFVVVKAWHSVYVHNYSGCSLKIL